MSDHVKTRLRVGNTQVELHRINGETAWLDTIDARKTVRDHPEEWGYQPFSADQQKAARRDMVFSA